MTPKLVPEGLDAPTSQAWKKLLDEHDRLRALLDNIPDVVFFKDPNGVFLDCNAAFTDLLGFSRYEIIGNTDRAIIDEAQYERLRVQDMQVIKQETTLRIQDVWRNYQGRSIEMEVIKAPIFDDLGNLLGILGIGRDITHQRHMEDRLRHLAHHDPLTQLPNRSLLAERVVTAMSNAIQHARLMSVAYVDLDGFKPINDTFGHTEGDRLLIEIAGRIQICLRAGDTVARLGGDEFAILLVDLEDSSEANFLLEEILSAIAAPFEVNQGMQVSVSGSIGYTLFPTDNADADTLLRHADQAMYHAKMAGRNRAHQFDLVLDKQERRQIEVCDRIATAVRNNELVLHFQPLVDMRKGIVLGAEALVRWQHPERGLLMPAEFLPQIENSDVIVQIGYWVLAHALACLDRWHREGLEIQISVNIAARHIMDADFLPNLKDLLNTYPNLKPSALELEILETAALDDMAHVSGLMSDCRQLGVKFALDDFGTGYSSLSYFKQLSADTLKIDQSFVRDILDDPEDLAIVEGILGLTTAFKRHAIAEGVETIEHGILLLHLGCDYAQGYGIARPMPADLFPAWVRGFEPDPSWVASTTLRWHRNNFPLVSVEVDHRQWVENIALAVHGSSIFSEQQLSLLHDHTHCRFGAWYAGIGKEQFEHLEEFRNIAPLHDQLHAIAGEIGLDLLAGNLPAARARFSSLQEIEFELRDALSTLQVIVAMGVMD